MDTIYKLKQIYESLNPEYLVELSSYHGLEDSEHNNLAWMMVIDTIKHQRSQMPPVNVYFDCSSGMLGTVCDLLDVDKDSKKIASVTYQEYNGSSISKVYPKRYTKLASTMEEHGAKPKKTIYYDRIDVMEPYQGQGWSSRINCTFYRNWSDEGYTHALLKDQADIGYWEHQIVDKGIGAKIPQEGHESLYLINLYNATKLECDTISYH